MSLARRLVEPSGTSNCVLARARPERTARLHVVLEDVAARLVNARRTVHIRRVREHDALVSRFAFGFAQTIWPANS